MDTNKNAGKPQQPQEATAKQNNPAKPANNNTTRPANNGAKQNHTARPANGPAKQSNHTTPANNVAKQNNTAKPANNSAQPTANKTNNKNYRKPNQQRNQAKKPVENKSVAEKVQNANVVPDKNDIGEKIKNAKSRVAKLSGSPRVSSMGSRGAIRIIPLGGLGEVGKNITYYEYNNEAILVDCGMAFPDESMPGIDIVIPDFTYVVENQKKIKALFITHGHEDHIGSIPYLLKHFNVPIYGTRLTLGLIEGKLKEHGLLRNTKLNMVKAGDTVKVSQNISVEYIHVNHSIPDACSLAIHTPAGVIIQTGDFKVDYTPIAGEPIDLARFGELGNKGVLALLSDSTNAEKPGVTSSEKTVGESLDKLFINAQDKRIIVATFASNVHRVQQILDAAVKYGRKVAVSGRSMENVTSIASELGYLIAPKDVMINVEDTDKLPNEKVVLITTGSQGEPLSALARMAKGEHRKVTVTNQDCIIISATPIPGNEKLVTNVINDLMKIGADVIYEKMYDIHVSGHACQDELKLMMLLTKPKYFIPVHGEFKHLKRHSEIARAMGIPAENMFIPENGKVIEVTNQGIKHEEIVQAGKVLVDGLGIGDVGSVVLRDRMHLSEDGLIVVIATIKRSTGQIVSGPDIVSRGFVYVRESENMLSKAKNIAGKAIETSIGNGSREWSVLKNKVRDEVGDFVWQTTKRRPMILPVIQEIQ